MAAPAPNVLWRSPICGIAGLYAPRQAPIPEAVVARQCDAILHRGPDNAGILADGDFAFGMRRLSIIDIDGSDQPIFSEDGRHAIVFNGEIYNFRALRDELRRIGHRFGTAGDTEVILAAFRQWGSGAWTRLDGMFAAAIWDRRDRTLTLARDQVGIKPLYYSWQRGRLAFGSELKALLALDSFEFEPDPQAMHDYFSVGHVRAPRSIYRQVSVLPPGHALRLGADGRPQLEEFWRADYVRGERRPASDWIDEFRSEWLTAVRAQMLAADVDVGAFLSGGVDSSAVVAAMSRQSDRPVKTFTIGFAERAYDESQHAEAVARHLGCDHRAFIVDQRKAWTILPAIQRAYDEPFADPSAVPTWYLSEAAASEVKVVLSGDGGDELFFGYKRHLTEKRIDQLPSPLRHAMSGFAKLPPLPFERGNRTLQRWQRTARSAALPNGAARFFAKMQITTPELRRRLFQGTLLQEIDDERTVSALVSEHSPDLAIGASSGLEQFAMCDLRLNLPAAMLTKVDRASMSHSLEVRVPMLSQRIVALALRMPADVKLHGSVGKYPVREAVAPWLPAGVLNRRKQGFQMPIAEWFKGDLDGYARELWNDSCVAASGILNPAAVAACFDEHMAGRRDHSRFLYALALFCLWWLHPNSAVKS